MKKRKEAFYTPEAAFVLLTSLFVIFALIYLAFYLHDIQNLQSEMNRLADRAAAENWTLDKIRDEAEVKLNKKGLGLLFIEVEAVEVYQEAKKPILEIDIKASVPWFAEMFFQDVVQTGKMRSGIDRHEPEEFARQTEAVKEVIE